MYWWVGQCLVLFYNHFHYRICFNDFRYEIRFWWSVNGFCYENRITNKSSISWFDTPLDKSFLLWKWILWCINWFSLWKWPFMLYDSCDSRGAPAPFHFMVSRGRRESESESLVVSLFEKQDFTQANYICRYLDLWLLVYCESDYNPHTNLWSAWHSPRFRALPPTN